jgi:hypothetical protein
LLKHTYTINVDLTAQAFDDTQNLSYEVPDSDNTELKFDQMLYVAFKSKDWSNDFASYKGWVDRNSNKMSRAFALSRDSYIQGITADVDPTNILPDQQLTTSNLIPTLLNLYRLLAASYAIQGPNQVDNTFSEFPETIRNKQQILETSANIGKRHSGGKMPWLIINNDIEMLIKLTLLNNGNGNLPMAGDQVLRNGSIGTLLGFDILRADTLLTVDGEVDIMCGINEATQYIERVKKPEKLRDINTIEDFIRNSMVMGKKVLIPKGLAKVHVDEIVYPS